MVAEINGGGHKNSVQTQQIRCGPKMFLVSIALLCTMVVTDCKATKVVVMEPIRAVRTAPQDPSMRYLNYLMGREPVKRNFGISPDDAFYKKRSGSAMRDCLFSPLHCGLRRKKRGV